MTSIERLIADTAAPSAANVLAAVLTDLQRLAAVHGKPSIWDSTKSEHVKRLTIQMAMESWGDDDIGLLLAMFLRGHVHECAQNGDPEELECAAEEMLRVSERIANQFQQAADYQWNAA